MATRSSQELEVRGSNLGSVKLDSVLPTARHRCDISSKEAVLPAGTMTRRRASQTRYTLWCNTARIMEDLIFQTEIAKINLVLNSNVTEQFL